MADAVLSSPARGDTYQAGPIVTDWPIGEYLAQAVYCVEANVTYDSSDLSANGSSSPGLKTLFNAPANSLIIALAYQVQTAFISTNRPLQAEIQVGDTNAGDRYGTLSASVLGSTRSKGFWPIFEEVTAEVTIEAGGFVGLAETQGAGAVQFWLLYMPRSDVQKLPGT